MTTDIPMSLYIHLPWCVKKCPYCDFNAHPLKDNTPKHDYITHLIDDLHSHRNILTQRPLKSVFIGGGTPSVFNAQELKPLFDALYQYLPPDIEITMEVNPGVVDHASFPGYQALGINRLSIGGQSFNQDSLSHLGRAHSASHTHQAIRIAKEVGFKRINLDLMYGTPHQTLEHVLYDLEQFLAYDLEHLSWYQLNIEANTLFAVKKPLLPSVCSVETMETIGQSILKSNNYQAYEISAWTKGKPSFHNLNYWTFGDYLGIGCGAHSKITTNHNITRLIKQKHPKAYMSMNKVQQATPIAQPEILVEFCINFFRTTQWMSFETLAQRTGISKESFITKMKAIIDKQWLKVDQDGFQNTPLGQRHYHDICLSIH